MLKLSMQYAGVVVAGCSSSGKFRTSLKGCTHLTACSLSVVLILSFTVADWPILLAQKVVLFENCFHMSCLQHTFILPLAAAHSALQASISSNFITPCALFALLVLVLISNLGLFQEPQGLGVQHLGL